MSKLSATAISAMIIIVVSLAFVGGFFFGQTHEPANPSALGVVEQAWNLIFSEYVDLNNLDAENMTRGAIEGIVEAVDRQDVRP